MALAGIASRIAVEAVDGSLDRRQRTTRSCPPITAKASAMSITGPRGFSNSATGCDWGIAGPTRRLCPRFPMCWRPARARRSDPRRIGYRGRGAPPGPRPPHRARGFCGCRHDCVRCATSIRRRPRCAADPDTVRSHAHRSGRRPLDRERRHDRRHRPNQRQIGRDDPLAPEAGLIENGDEAIGRTRLAAARVRQPPDHDERDEHLPQRAAGRVR